MNKSILIIILFLATVTVNSFAQQALFGGEKIASPEVKAYHTVTFRVQAPDAREVKITGDWMPLQGWVRGSEGMTKDEKGMWNYTTKPLESDLYGYSIIIDGLKTIDPSVVEPLIYNKEKLFANY